MPARGIYFHGLLLMKAAYEDLCLLRREENAVFLRRTFSPSQEGNFTLPSVSVDLKCVDLC